VDTAQLAKIAQALADPTRLSILERIAATGEMSCSAITSEHGLAPGTVSHHLKTLAEAGLIESRREGQFIYNRALPAALEKYADEIRRLGAQSARARKR
jgi:ArsR family transcriptional regulator, arsenate/arsenite/antimonite-responsive transcriptional repressor